MAVFWDDSQGPIFGFGGDRRNDNYYRKSFEEWKKNYSKKSEWVFTEGDKPYKLEEFNKDKYWRGTFPNKMLSVSFIEVPSAQMGEWSQVEIKDHYGECIRLPISIVDTALNEHSEAELAMIRSRPNASKEVALIIVKYCIRNALICAPLEELNI